MRHFGISTLNQVLICPESLRNSILNLDACLGHDDSFQIKLLPSKTFQSCAIKLILENLSQLLHFQEKMAFNLLSLDAF